MDDGKPTFAIPLDGKNKSVNEKATQTKIRMMTPPGMMRSLHYNSVMRQDCRPNMTIHGQVDACRQRAAGVESPRIFTRAQHVHHPIGGR